MRQIVECVANFSEGQRQDVIEAIVQAVASADGVYILAYESDRDHHRSVVTFIGSPDSIVQGAFNGITTAAQLIDLDAHQGQHPRVGAADVVPFIPIEGVTLDDCVHIAHALGKRVGDELGIPVYLYEAAAARSERKNLEDVRRGGYEVLKDTIGRDPDREPDYGPNVIGKAGAVVIGARMPLIAYNIYLTTDNVEIAKNIASAVRHSSGGLRFVKALGLSVKGKAQVSMNFTDYAQTPVYRVFELIRREAQRYGVGIESSELVGLIPQQAVLDSAQWYLQLDSFEPGDVLENRVREVLSQQDVFLDDLSSENPVPGGGGAAAYSGAIAAALVIMIAKGTLKKPKYSDSHERMKEIAAEGTRLRNHLHNLVKQDGKAYTEVLEAFRLPKEKPDREVRIELALQLAAEVPLQAAAIAVDVLKLAVEVAQKGNINAISDAGVAGITALSALQSSALTVRMNVKSMKTKNTADRILHALHALEVQSLALETTLSQVIYERTGIQNKTAE